MSTELSQATDDREALVAALALEEEETQLAQQSVERLTRQVAFGQAAEELHLIELEYKRRRYLTDPVFWAQDRCGLFLWSKQREILKSICLNRRTAVRSCHEIGKSFIAAVAIAWWIDNHRPGSAFAVTSAPTARQVRAILWREVNRLHGAANLRGRTNQTEWFLTSANGKEELVAFGQKPADMDPTAFQGIHAEAVLLVFDEACGFPKPLWDAGDSLVANDDSRVLAIGNPDDPTSEFAEVCKPGSGWNVVGVSAFDTPNFTGEEVPEYLLKVLIGKIWVEEKKRKWGEENPLYKSKILGEFPNVSTDSLIPLSCIRAAQERELTPDMPIELGCDVGAGGDKNIQCLRRGAVARIIRRDSVADTMQSCGNIILALRETGAIRAKIDEIGVGRGLVDRGLEQGAPFLGVNVARTPKDPITFLNLRAEGYWSLRERFIAGAIDIDANDEDLAAQLSSLKYKVNSRGQIVIQSKDEIRKETGRSPDDVDALMLAFVDPLPGAAPKARGGLLF